MSISANTSATVLVASDTRLAKEFRQECQPHIESIRSLNALAKRVRPAVLVVDDDKFQRKIVRETEITKVPFIKNRTKRRLG